MYSYLRKYLKVKKVKISRGEIIKKYLDKSSISALPEDEEMFEVFE
jgi:hypothetical protein